MLEDYWKRLCKKVKHEKLNKGFSAHKKILNHVNINCTKKNLAMQNNSVKTI